MRSRQAWLSASSERLSRGTTFSSVKLHLHSRLHEAARPQVPCSRSPFTATEASGGREQVCCLFTLIKAYVCLNLAAFPEKLSFQGAKEIIGRQNALSASNCWIKSIDQLPLPRHVKNKCRVTD
ncbi:uncharacterized protein LOC113891142 [Bos indicus x Bos taurus]|uniref:uncharacterized protein LOC113891142 n=1 Tax=Bos indicus x Bos taurus TaxID=30522 RepID=UPI000D533B1E|nr:uncharacterized protein LOC112446427 isoform X2 [Bos taurus]XP_024846949.1 uncharacterized protein LOC112446427 isoform X2 [Bos taurus]XP_027394653.1 uncharacterized protein LOC113891142 [Bos indicus x Bos taurus]